MQFIRPSRTLLIIGGLVTLSLAAGVVLLYIYETSAKPESDHLLKKALHIVSSATSYSQKVETEATFPDRKLLITGIYTVDNKAHDFGSYSTTTLMIGRDPVGHTFTHTNLALGSDIYMKLETEDALLKKSIQASSSWQRFTSTAIPKNFADIAVPGPIQDNLRILGESGAWISLIKKQGPVAWGNEQLIQYTFRLSGRQPKQGDPAASLLSRISPAGVVDVWIDPATSEPRYLRFANSTYISTTTISAINVPLSLHAPAEL